jgi:2-haloacid dehalogenase
MKAWQYGQLSPYDIPGAGRLGMDLWWHNRIGTPGRPRPGLVAEHCSLDPVPVHRQR